MLRPRPKFPLQISIIVSLPARIGQLRGSEVKGLESGQWEHSSGDVFIVLRDVEEDGETRRSSDEAAGKWGRWETDEGREWEEDKGWVLERLMESLTVTQCSRIKLDTWIQRGQSSHKSLNQLDLAESLCGRICIRVCIWTFSTDSPATGSSPTATILSPTFILPSYIWEQERKCKIGRM